jgi:hypothetical protein
MDGDAGERAQYAHGLDRLPPAPRVHHEQGVFAGAGAVHPVQLSVHPEPGLVEPGGVAGGDSVPDPFQEPAEPPGGAGGDGRDRAGRQRDAEQFGQRLCGPLLRQELPGVEVDDDRGDPRPVLHGGFGAHGGCRPGALPAPAFPLDQLMLSHLGPHRRQVQHLAALHRGHRRSRQARAAARAAGRLVPHLPVRPGHRR